MHFRNSKADCIRADPISFPFAPSEFFSVTHLLIKSNPATAFLLPAKHTARAVSRKADSLSKPAQPKTVYYSESRFPSANASRSYMLRPRPPIPSHSLHLFHTASRKRPRHQYQAV